MRGSSLADRDVLKALEPFVVVTWSGRPSDEAAAEIQAIWKSSGIVYARKKRTNVFGFVLDSDGNLVHSFGAFPKQAINPNASGPSQDVRYFREEIAKGVAKVKIPEGKSVGELRLPDVSSGVRLFVRTRGPGGDLPVVVEAVADEQWKELSYPEAKTAVDSKKLAPWLRLIYPPGFNEQMYGWKKIEGAFTLEPAGANRALLQGTVRLATRNTYREREEIVMEATVEAVMTYREKTATSLRAVVQGKYPRDDEFRGPVVFSVQAVIESRPE